MIILRIIIIIFHDNLFTFLEYEYKFLDVIMDSIKLSVDYEPRQTIAEAIKPLMALKGFF